ncbi:MAG: Replicase polyprotein 1a [Acidimicrobiales bacterium]|nr:Replicase polyprotein 1a [Acidimicrobiales bacterium]
MKMTMLKLGGITVAGALSLGALSAMPASAATSRPAAAKAADRDRDGMPDKWEKANRLNPNDKSDAGRDADKDGLTNVAEFRKGGNPRSSDSDHDGIKDGREHLVKGKLAGFDANHNGRRDGLDDEDHDGVDNEHDGDGVCATTPATAPRVSRHGDDDCTPEPDECPAPPAPPAGAAAQRDGSRGSDDCGTDVDDGPDDHGTDA